ncbi:exported hypothetical protein [Mesorhizobium plurifarium]|uniref:Uncharacterized protein n=1 Tax=Mesorhizobium plurifarium TaxID=69974 RepID=A0A0K2VTS9_MESPL|nr:exported hypothetical protein [Mesorhizobium plurifarium]
MSTSPSEHRKLLRRKEGRAAHLTPSVAAFSLLSEFSWASDLDIRPPARRDDRGLSSGPLSPPSLCRDRGAVFKHDSQAGDVGTDAGAKIHNMHSDQMLADQHMSGLPQGI